MIKASRDASGNLSQEVDYSGRSVIVVGPDLSSTSAASEEDGLELFKPLYLQQAREKGYATTIKAAKKLVEKESPMSGRARRVIRSPVSSTVPDLHVSASSIDPILVEGKAIKLHPLVCTASTRTRRRPDGCPCTALYRARLRPACS